MIWSCIWKILVNLKNQLKLINENIRGYNTQYFYILIMENLRMKNNNAIYNIALKGIKYLTEI